MLIVKLSEEQILQEYFRAYMVNGKIYMYALQF